MGKRKKSNKKPKTAKCECQNRLKKAIEKSQSPPKKPKLNEEIIFNKKKGGKKTRKSKR